MVKSESDNQLFNYSVLFRQTKNIWHCASKYTYPLLVSLDVHSTCNSVSYKTLNGILLLLVSARFALSVFHFFSIKRLLFKTADNNRAFFIMNQFTNKRKFFYVIPISQNRR